MITAQKDQLLAGKGALVTGASSGLGRAVGLALAKAGTGVGLIARSEIELRQLVQEIEASGEKALALPLDLASASEEDLASAVKQTVERFGRIDLLVNCAGTDVPGKVAELNLSDWDRVLAVNLRAPFVLAKAAFPYMQQAGRGTILNISSVAGKRGWANASAYCASKFGLSGLTQALAAEGKPYGIRAGIIYPGGMATGWGDWTAEERRTKAEVEKTPAEALPPERVAELIVWIASSPGEMVLNEVIVTPLQEKGWP
ncbi:MAG TPA: SDR family oxidoreductase [Chloroflexia bacterium]|nr:SDR family oxidoreductase [Chloroflexia bacterium]